MVEPRLSHATLRILRVFLMHPGQELAGADITRNTGIRSGTVYPTLTRLEVAGWLSSKWERGDASDLGRPLRRLYKLTGAGTRKAREVLHDLR